MNFGFVVNNRTCIGCHACSTACKSENEVPLGVYRTWVKYTETGAYPDVRRNFQVTRCNHCSNPPCVRICPVTAMYQRDDGIVEFDADECIGCRACMQACPYDAIYLDPESRTAAKCHYCSHRTELGLEPACVVVCPEHSILAGDMDDPESEISRVLASETVTVRKPEQGTAPKLYYIGGHDSALHPTATARSPASFMWADVLRRGDDGRRLTAGHNSHGGRCSVAPVGTAIRVAERQGVPSAGPFHIGGGIASDHMVQVGYNAQHTIPWHWPVPAYLVTKAIAAGVLMLIATGLLTGGVAHDPRSVVAAGFASLLFTIITTGLLVYDLGRPERFLRILTRPQWASWLTRGAAVLIACSLVSGIWWLAEAGAVAAVGGDGLAAAIRPLALWAGFVLAIAVAVYTAFLFGQAEGRDLWQSPLLPAQLVVQAFLAGAATTVVLAVVVDLPADLSTLATRTLGIAIATDLFLTLVGEFGMPHASEIAARVAHDIRHGRYRHHFWVGGITAGHLAPLLLLIAGSTGASVAAGMLALIGLYLFEYAFVMAPQDLPNS